MTDPTTGPARPGQPRTGDAVGLDYADGTSAAGIWTVTDDGLPAVRDDGGIRDLDQTTGRHVLAGADHVELEPGRVYTGDQLRERRPATHEAGDLAAAGSLPPTPAAGPPANPPPTSRSELPAHPPDDMQMTLPTCVLPGCRNLVSGWGRVCPGCVADFGPYLEPADRPQLTQEQIHDRDDAVRAANSRMLNPAPASGPEPEAPERKRNQLCWLCEQRRTCTPAEQGWECDECRTVA